MDEKWRNYMSLTERRIENIIKAMKRAKDYEMKAIWSSKLQQLFKTRKTKAYDRIRKTY